MGKIRVGSIRQTALIEGDANLLSYNEILVSKDEGYTIIRKRLPNGNLETYVMVPLKDFNNGVITGKKMEET